MWDRNAGVIAGPINRRAPDAGPETRGHQCRVEQLGCPPGRSEVVGLDTL